MIEVWLMSKDQKQQLRLPVPPEEYGPDGGVEVANINVHSLGEVGLIGKRRLNVYSVETYFPGQVDSLCQYATFPKPEACVKLIEDWMKSGLPIRFIVTGGPLKVNTLAAVTDFSPRVRSGPGDIWFSLTLQEYRTIQPKKAKDGGKTNNSRDSDKAKTGTYTVKKGDTIKSIAKQVYGSSDKWKDLAKKNNLSTKKVPTLTVGQKLKY